MSQKLHLATYAEADAYWSGGKYELNMSFEMLRDKQWQRLIQTIWDHVAIRGPFEKRFIPGRKPGEAEVQVPRPTATLMQHGCLTVDTLEVGCCVLVTRSLFECVTLQVPLGMFEGLGVAAEASTAKASLRVGALDRIYQDIALAVFEVVPFDLANIGFQCECHWVAELQADMQQRLDFRASGYFFARDDVLKLLSVPPENYPSVRPNLRWVLPDR